ncbi:MAG: DUF7350 domain-containing protein [Halorhabdus sp.]
MYRRAFLATVTGTAAAGLAGCGSIESQSIDIPTVVEDRPNGIYVPSHVEEMVHVGTVTAGEYTVALSVSYPHRFWTVTGASTTRTSIADDDSIHLMATVFDRTTGQVLPDVGVTVEISREESLRYQESIYPMLSQPMGLHHGDNVAGLTDGHTYEFSVSVGAPSVRRTGSFHGRFGDSGSGTLSYTFDESEIRALAIDRLDAAGDRDAVDPMEMDAIPTGIAPRPTDLPGRTVTGEAGDVRYVATVIPSGPAGIDDGPYLAVSPRTRYNRFPLSRMGLSISLEREGQTVADARLTRALDPDLGYHYGMVLPDDPAGSDLAIEAETPPQVARHEGYETAFFDVGAASLSL